MPLIAGLACAHNGCGYSNMQPNFNTELAMLGFVSPALTLQWGQPATPRRSNWSGSTSNCLSLCCSTSLNLQTLVWQTGPFRGRSHPMVWEVRAPSWLWCIQREETHKIHPHKLRNILTGQLLNVWASARESEVISLNISRHLCCVRLCLRYIFSLCATAPWE